MQYYKFLLHERPDRFARRTGNYILQAGNLMMEFVVMAFLRTQDQKLRWCRKNQKKLRAETYKNVSKNVEAGDISIMEKRLYYLHHIMVVYDGIS